MKMAQFNMPLHLQAPDSEYIMENPYHSNRMPMAHEMAPWLEDQTDGGGKFRLKRRRRCGQCGPCQVKDNCGKCQYCLRKDILKQACIYRKCVYLRKPVPRFRTETAASSSSCLGSGDGAGVMGESTVNGPSNNSGSDTSCSQKLPTVTCSIPNGCDSQPTIASTNLAVASQSAEQGSCRLGQNPFGSVMNSVPAEPLGGGGLNHTAVAEASSMVDASRVSCLPGGHNLESGRSPALDPGRNTNTADSGFGTGSSLTTSPASSITKDRPSVLPGEQVRYPVDQWGAMPYGFPRTNPWTYPAFQGNPAATYGFQPGMNHFANPFASSCRLGMQDAASHLASHQPAFNYNMPFARPDFSAHAHHSAAAPSLAPAMTPPFYPPPPHAPSSLPNFPSFSQLPSNAGPHTAYPMAHPPMYPGNLYSSFHHSQAEPQIYHARLPPPCSPFRHSDQFPSAFNMFSQKKQTLNKEGRDSAENQEGLKKTLSALHVPSCKRVCDVNSDDSMYISLSKTAAKGQKQTQRDINDCTWQKDSDSESMLLKTRPESGIDDDLQQQLARVSGIRECSVMNFDDFKIQVFNRSDSFNNLEVEIENPSIKEANCLWHMDAKCGWSEHVFQTDDVSESSIEGGRCCASVRVDQSADIEPDRVVMRQNSSSQNSETPHVACVQAETVEPHPCGLYLNKAATESLRIKTGNVTLTVADPEACTDNDGNPQNTCRTLCDDVTLSQDLDEGVTGLEVPARQVRLEEVHLAHERVSASSDPGDLLHFLADGTVRPSSPDNVSCLRSDSDAADDVFPEGSS